MGTAGDYARDQRFGVVAEADEEISSIVAEMGAGTEAHRLHGPVRQVLARRARPPGLALLLDDLHLADEASQELLENLLLDLPVAPLLVAVAYQGHRVPPGLPRALARTRAAVTRLAPAPLDEVAVAQLLPDLPVRRRRLLVAVTGGNPLYLDALAPADEGTLAALATRDHGDPEDMPRRLRALLTSELRTLGDDTRLVAHAAAVAGDHAEPDLVADIAGRPESEVFAALDELVALGVLHTVGARFRFRHPLVLAAAYQSAGPAWRIAAHRRADEHLRARGGPLARRAHHLSRAGAGAQDAAETLVDAAAVALETAPASAADWLRAAVRMLPESHPRWAELLVLLARAVALSDRPGESREILHDVLDRAGGQRREAVRLYALADRLLGRLDESRALLEAELLTGGEGSGPLVVELAAAELLQGDLVACARHARDAAEDGLRGGDLGQVAAGMTLLGLATLLQGDVPAARERLAEAARGVDGLGDAELRDHLHVLPPLAWLELHLEQYGNAERHLARGKQIAQGNGRAHVMPYLLIASSALAERTGRLDVAWQEGLEAYDAAAAIDSAELMAMAAAVRLRTAVWRQGPHAALELAASAATGSAWWTAEADAAVVTALLLADRPAAVVTRVAGYLNSEATGLAAVHWRSSLAVAKSALRSWDEALELSEQALGLAAALELPFHRGLAHLARTRVLAHCGQLPASVTEAEAAAEWFTRAASPLHVAMASALGAESLAAAGDLQGARTWFGRAKEGYAACDAGWLLASVRNSESRLGARAPRPRRPEAAGTVDALSGREREVAELVAAGLTNREIAAALFLSVKTVEAHLARVFTKLGVKSRVGVAQRIGSRGLA
ncbi:hypothetical protein ADL03_06155 [Nocardia sp. NRRL S-836]|nr:hypothetical protein ADL03_06155 [Nocardia sp. NRRL S-836]